MLGKFDGVEPQQFKSKEGEKIPLPVLGQGAFIPGAGRRSPPGPRRTSA